MKNTSLNFGSIKESVAKKAAVEITRTKSSKTIYQFLESVRKNPILVKQQLIYKNFETVSPFEKERLAERFINQNLELFNNVEWTSIINENKKIRKDFLGLPDESTVVTNEEKQKLYESISNLIESKTNKSNFSNFQQEAESYEYLMNYLTSKKEEGQNMNEEKNESPNFLTKSWEFITRNAVSNFNERFSHLNESDKSIFQVLTSDENSKEDKIKALRQELSETINKKIKNCTSDEKEILEMFLKKVEKEVEKNIMISDEYIINMYDLKENLDHI